MKRSVIARAVAAEREKLVADLRQISAADWDRPSLCGEWAVRDVVAHLIRIGEYYIWLHKAGWDLARYGFRLNRALAEVAKRMAARRSPDELLARLDRTAYERTPVFWVHPQPLFALSEWIIHGQDIRRPLGLQATFEPSHLIATVQTAMKWYAWDARKRIAPARLEATDADWSVGTGPTYRGPLEAIVMVVMGRTSAMNDLVPTTDHGR